MLSSSKNHTKQKYSRTGSIVLSVVTVLSSLLVLLVALSVTLSARMRGLLPMSSTTFSVTAFVVVVPPSASSSFAVLSRSRSRSYSSSLSSASSWTTTVRSTASDTVLEEPVVSTAVAAAAVIAAAETEEVNVRKSNGNPRLVGLAYALDTGTRKSHSMAQNTAFVEGFFKGISTPDAYRQLLTSLYYVYAAMETDVLDNPQAIHNPMRSMLTVLDAPALRRLPGLEADLEYFYGPDWKTTMTPPSPATRAYLERIHTITETTAICQSYLFIAHQYTRYLGDLFGGQMMGTMASKSMDLPLKKNATTGTPLTGVQFYTFDDIDTTTTFIDDWYTTLNSLDLTPQQHHDIVDEANVVFDLNIALLQELDGSPWHAAWKLTVGSLQDQVDRYKQNKLWLLS